MNHQGLRLRSVIASCLAMFCIGIVYIWSVFQQPVIDYFGSSSELVSMLSSAIISMYVAGGLIGGCIQDRFSPRTSALTGSVLFFGGLMLSSFLGKDQLWLMFITYGVVTGLGVGFVYSGCINSIQKWFPGRRGFSTSLAVFAFGLSAAMYTTLIEWLLRRPSFGDHALPSTFRAIACIFGGAVLLFSCFIRNPASGWDGNRTSRTVLSERRQLTTREAIKTGEFWCIALTQFFQPAAYMMLLPLIKTIGAARGLSPAMLTLTVSLTGISSAVSRLLNGSLSDKIGRIRTLYLLTLLILCGAVALSFSKGLIYLIIVQIIVFGYNGPAGIFPALVTDSFGTKYSGSNWGSIFLFLGLSSLIFTRLAAVISKSGAETGDYTASFFTAAAVCVIPLTVLPLYNVWHKRRLERETPQVPMGQAAEQ